jgi:diacylglycerol kinase family enzyme/membrane-associated phospholipid phosphatase
MSGEPVGKRERHQVLHALDAWDRSLFRDVARRRSPLLDRLLPRLTRAADHSAIWVAAAGGLTATGRRRQRRAALRGLSSVAVTSLLVNQVAKRVAARPRPLLASVPAARSVVRLPSSTSFPSGHAASAAAFAVGAGLELPALAIPLGALAAAVGFSRVYTGVHYPGDVIVGAAAGAGIAALGARLAPARTPSRVRPPEPVIDQQEPRPAGAGIVAVVNPQSGGGRGARAAEAFARELPEAELVLWQPGTDLDEVLRKAAARAEVLAAVGGDGTVDAAAHVAIQADVPLLVVPGGTFNHLAADLGFDRVGDAIRAVCQGTATRIDVGTVAGRYFINTAGVGSYPAFVAARERRQRRWGKGLASALAVVEILRTEQPLHAVIDNRPCSVATMFIGNCRYNPSGFVPIWRQRLDDGQLDVRLLETGHRWAPARLMLSFLTGRLGRSRLYREYDSVQVHVMLRDGPALLARDGEVGPSVAEANFGKKARALMVYVAPHKFGRRATRSSLPRSAAV